MNFPIQQAIAENNEGVALLESGREYPEAISHFSNALSLFKVSLTGLRPKNYLSAEAGQVFKTSIDECILGTCRTSINSKDGSQFLFRHGIQIPTDMGLAFYNERQRTTVSCMIIFNFALACQLSASSSAGEEVVIANLNKAIKLYQLSFNLQRNANMDGNVLFSLAVVNNLGICHRQLHNQEDSGKCFEYVLSTLMFLTDCGEVSELYKYLDGFFFNVAHLISQPTVAPAA
mmetsp:Transcript_24119/g.44838  ORF Transcript_24119/g.44838 Transcript_24119/m.44838 type:complete len:232 (+) Transcript_24119:226-921(+)